MTFKYCLMRVAVASALLGCVVSGCDDSNNNAKPSDSAGSSAGGKGGKGGSSGSKAAGAGGSGSSGKGGSSASAGKGGSGDKGGAGGSGGSGDDNDAGTTMPTDCKGVADCFCGAPTKNEQFLNQCTEATCNPYDNSKLSKFKDGKLPAIP